jgi:hypothetical protein
MNGKDTQALIDKARESLAASAAQEQVKGKQAKGFRLRRMPVAVAPVPLRMALRRAISASICRM